MHNPARIVKFLVLSLKLVVRFSIMGSVGEGEEVTLVEVVDFL